MNCPDEPNEITKVLIRKKQDDQSELEKDKTMEAEKEKDLKMSYHWL